MKQYDLMTLSDRRQTSDARSGLGPDRITARGQHYAGRGFVGPTGFEFAETPFGYRLKDLHEIALQTNQNCLGLRISETHIVLEDARTIGGEHEPDEEDSAKGKALSQRAIKCRLDNLFDDSIPRCLIEHA